MVACDIKQQTININCNSATFTTDVELLESIRILFPISNAVFKGRDSVFDELSEYLAKTQIAVICGMAGIGKTECSKQFAWSNSGKYGMKLWLNTDTTENIQKSVHEIARKLSITVFEREVANIINDIYDYFENRNICTLFVFDNANDRRSINHLLPIKEYHDKSLIHILITSQNNKWGKRNKKDIPIIELNPLEVEFAVDVFREIIEDNFDSHELALWENLANYLNNIPLALQITASYIKNEIESIEGFGSDDETFSLRDYIKKLEDELHLIIDEPFPDDSENAYSRTIYIAVSVTLDKIKTKEQFWSSAFDTLYAISYLNPNYIYREILLRFMPEENVRKSLEVLTKYSLINSNNFKQTKRITIHRLVQWILRYHQKNTDSETPGNNYKKVLEKTLNYDDRCSFHHSVILKYETQFSHIIKDFIVNGNLYLLHVLIEFDCSLTVSLICNETLELPIDQVVKWLRLALALNQINCLRVFLEYLEKRNVDFNTLKTNGGIFLFAAMRWLPGHQPDRLDCVRLLLDKCTDLNVRDFGGGNYTPIMMAIENGHSNVVKLFLQSKRVDLNCAENNGWTAFHYLIGSSYFQEREIDLSPDCLGALFVEAGAKLNVIDVKGRSLLHQACRYPSPGYIEFLIKHKLDVNFKDNKGLQPLLLLLEHTPQQSLLYSPYLSLRNEPILIKCLDVMIKYGADINATDENGKTILHLAAQYYPLVVEHLILAYKMDVNIRDATNQTPLFDIQNSDEVNSITNIVKCLISNGALINVKDSNGFSPHTWALKLSRHKVAEVLATYLE